jgi:hypothetical protein
MKTRSPVELLLGSGFEREANSRLPSRLPRRSTRRPGPGTVPDPQRLACNVGSRSFKGRGHGGLLRTGTVRGPSSGRLGLGLAAVRLRTFHTLWFLLSVVCAFGLFGATAAPTRPVSVPGLAVVSGAGNSFTPLFSGNGQFVVFVSQANNLVTNDDLAPYLDVFVRDLLSHRTTLVSVNSSGIGGGDGNSNFPTISSNGQFVVFESIADNLAGQDTNRVNDLFVRDVLAGTTALVSISTNRVSSGNGASSNPAITPDGRWVVFESAASDLVPDDTNGVADIFVRDLQAGVTWLVSVDQTNASSAPSITPDGRFVAFVNSIPNANPSSAAWVWSDVYVRDRF